VHACLAKDPDKRPANARAVADAIAAFSSEGAQSSDDVAVVPSRPSFPRMTFALSSLLGQRKRLAIAAGALGAGVILVVAATHRSHPQAEAAAPEPVRALPPATVATTIPVDVPTPASALPPAVMTAMSAPLAVHDNTTAHRASEPARAPMPSSRPTAKPPTRPAPGKAAARRPSPEDDDRIE
jgi:hypothetical protein